MMFLLCKDTIGSGEWKDKTPLYWNVLSEPEELSQVLYSWTKFSDIVITEL